MTADATVDDVAPGRWRQPWKSLRVRITAAATAAFVVVFALASFALIQRVNASLQDDLRTASEQAISCAGSKLSTGVDGPVAVTQTCGYGVPLEVIDANGKLIAGQPGVAGSFGATAAPPDRVFSTSGGPEPGAGGTTSPDVLLVQGEAQTPKGDVTLVVRQPLDNVKRTIDTLRSLLFLLVPLVAAGVALIVWVVVDRALQPVEKLRAEVDQISHSTISRRLPEPGSASEIDRLAQTMNDMLGRLETSSTQQRQFVSDAGHELKTPLATIRATVEVARRETDPDWVAVTDRVLASEQRLEALVDDLLTLAQFDENAATAARTRQAVDLEDLVLLWASSTNVDARVTVDLAGVVAGRVHGDERELRRLVGNILDNAVQHATSRVAVSLRAGSSGAGIVLAVDDDGPGVPIDQREAIFDRFARLDASRVRASAAASVDQSTDAAIAPVVGTGLGLAIAQACAVRHGGSIAVSDSPLGGARFEVRLPA